MTLTEQHISDLIGILKVVIPMIAFSMYIWALQNANCPF